MKNCSNAIEGLPHKPNSKVIYGNFRGENLTASSETTLYIYAQITDWRHCISQPSPQEPPLKTNLHIQLEATLAAGTIFDEPLPLSICLVSDSDDNDIDHLSPWQLDVIPPQNEPPIPRCLEAVIILAETTLRDIKECLFLTARSPGSSAQLSLALREKPAAASSDVAERSFEIVEFNFTLQHQTRNMCN